MNHLSLPELKKSSTIYFDAVYYAITKHILTLTSLPAYGVQKEKFKAEYPLTPCAALCELDLSRA